MKILTITSLILIALIFTSCGNSAKKEETSTKTTEQAADTPSVEYLHAFKAVFNAKYLKKVASDAGGTNKFIHTTVLPNRRHR